MICRWTPSLWVAYPKMLPYKNSNALKGLDRFDILLGSLADAISRKTRANLGFKLINGPMVVNAFFTNNAKSAIWGSFLSSLWDNDDSDGVIAHSTGHVRLDSLDGSGKLCNCQIQNTFLTKSHGHCDCRFPRIYPNTRQQSWTYESGVAVFDRGWCAIVDVSIVFASANEQNSLSNGVARNHRNSRPHYCAMAKGTKSSISRKRRQ